MDPPSRAAADERPRSSPAGRPRRRWGRAAAWTVAALTALGLASWAVVESLEPPRHHLPRLQALLGSGPVHGDPRGDVLAPGEPIRVLFYGQSITRQAWWQGVAEHLQRRHPDRRFEFHNLAVGGHDAGRLVRMVDTDVLPLQPDLVIFHVYGRPAELRRTLQRIRAGTAADVLLANDHLVRDAELAEETSDLLLFESGRLRRILTGLGLMAGNADWQAWRNHEFLPDLADELAIALADVRHGWARELRASGLPAAAYLADDIHLNARGEALMQRLVIESLEHHLQAAQTAPGPRARTSRREVEVGPSCESPLLTDGYRIDLAGVAGLRLGVRVDGEEAADHPALPEIGRASSLPGTHFPGVLRVGRRAASAPAEGASGATTPAADATAAAALADGRARDLAPVLPGRHSLRLGPRDASGHYAVSWRLEGGSIGVDGSTAEPLHWKEAGLFIAPEDWNLAYAEQVFGVPSFSGAEVVFEARTPGPVLRLAGSIPVTAARFRGNEPHRLCLRTLDGRRERVQLIEHRAAFDCMESGAACAPAGGR